MWEKIKLLFSVLRQGQELSNPEVWKNAQAAAGLIVSLLVSAKAAYGWNVPQELLQNVADAVAGVAGLLVAYWAYATSKRVGMPAADKADTPPAA